VTVHFVIDQMKSAVQVRDADPYVENRPGDTRSFNRKLLDLQDLLFAKVTELQTELAAARKARLDLTAQFEAERKARTVLLDRLCAPIVTACHVGTHSAKLFWSPPPLQLAVSEFAGYLQNPSASAAQRLSFSVELSGPLDSSGPRPAPERGADEKSMKTQLPCGVVGPRHVV
jgi:hypothetical protein